MKTNGGFAKSKVWSYLSLLCKYFWLACFVHDLFIWFDFKRIQIFWNEEWRPKFLELQEKRLKGTDSSGFAILKSYRDPPPYEGVDSHDEDIEGHENNLINDDEVGSCEIGHEIQTNVVKSFSNINIYKYKFEKEEVAKKKKKKWREELMEWIGITWLF